MYVYHHQPPRLRGHRGRRGGVKAKYLEELLWRGILWARHSLHKQEHRATAQNQLYQQPVMGSGGACGALPLTLDPLGCQQSGRAGVPLSSPGSEEYFQTNSTGTALIKLSKSQDKAKGHGWGEIQRAGDKSDRKVLYTCMNLSKEKLNYLFKRNFKKLENST